MALALVGCGSAAATVKVQTGDPLPARRAASAACPTGERWLESDPHVPLAVVTIAHDDAAQDFVSASACCGAWAHAGDLWTSVDFWGAPTGTHAITGGEGYDVTQCWELSCANDTGSLLVRGDEPWRAPASAAWVPDEAQRAAAYRLAASIDAVVAREPPKYDHDQAKPASPVDRRTTFFRMAPFSDEGTPTKFVAIGGRALAVAGLDQGGAWRVLYLDTSWGLDNPYLGDVYRVIGVFDMNHDGFPEVIAHRNAGDSWDDVVLGCSHDSTYRLWHALVEGVGGSTA